MCVKAVLSPIESATIQGMKNSTLLVEGVSPRLQQFSYAVFFNEIIIYEITTEKHL